MDLPDFSSTPSVEIFGGTHLPRVQFDIPPAKAPELDSTHNNDDDADNSTIAVLPALQQLAPTNNNNIIVTDNGAEPMVVRLPNRLPEDRVVLHVNNLHNPPTDDDDDAISIEAPSAVQYSSTHHPVIARLLS